MDAGLQTLFECLLTVQFVVVVAHDLVDIPGWTHGSQVQALIGLRKLLLVTLINGMFPGFAAAFALFYWNRPKPRFVLNYSVIYCAGTVAFAITMWYVPYIFGGSKKQKRDYADIYTQAHDRFFPRAVTIPARTFFTFTSMRCLRSIWPLPWRCVSENCERR